jgi:hypothetical protein
MDYPARMTNEQKLARAADLLRQQTAQIKELEAEIDRLHSVIEGSCDALMHLQRIYTDPKLPTSVTLKAAGAALAYEGSKPPPISANVTTSFYDLLKKKRLRQKIIDAKPDPAA